MKDSAQMIAELTQTNMELRNQVRELEASMESLRQKPSCRLQRAFGPREMLHRSYRTLPWDGEWARVFGQPDINDTWFVSGSSASGKSSFCMQLAKKLCEYGSVLYVSIEEGVSMSFCDRIRRYHMEEVQRKFRITTDGSIDSLRERLARRKSAKFIILDSFQFLQNNYNWTFKDASMLVDEFPHKCFVFISQEVKSEPLGKAAVRLKYLSGVKVRVVGLQAFCQGRYISESGASFTVWDDGVMHNGGMLT